MYTIITAPGLVRLIDKVNEFLGDDLVRLSMNVFKFNGEWTCRLYYTHR